MVSGWFKDEFTQLGEPWLEHDERYRRTAEFLQVLRKIWTEDDVEFRGDFYRIHDFTLKPKPLNSPSGPNPEIFQGGNSTAARATAAGTPTGTSPTARTSTASPSRSSRCATTPASVGREVSFGLNGFIIARDTETEARDTLREIIAKANARRCRASATPSSRRATRRRTSGMWADSSFEDLVQYNDGFRTQLIGTPEQIAERIVAYRKRGVDLFLGGFLHFQEEIEYFGARVLPLVREIEDSEADSEGEPSLARVRFTTRLHTTGALAWVSKPRPAQERSCRTPRPPATPDTRPRSNPRLSSPRRPNSSERRPNPTQRPAGPSKLSGVSDDRGRGSGTWRVPVELRSAVHAARGLLHADAA